MAETGTSTRPGTASGAKLQQTYVGRAAAPAGCGRSRREWGQLPLCASWRPRHAGLPQIRGQLTGAAPGAAATPALLQSVLPAATRRRRRVGTRKYRFRDDADWEGTCADGRCRCKLCGLDRCVDPFLLCVLWSHCRSSTVEADRGVSAAALGVLQSPPGGSPYRFCISNLRSGPIAIPFPTPERTIPRAAQTTCRAAEE